MIQVELELYGPLKRYGPVVTLEVAEPATATSVKQALVAALAGQTDPRLVELSALGDDDHVLSEHEAVCAGRYAVLPPVAGG